MAEQGGGRSAEGEQDPERDLAQEGPAQEGSGRSASEAGDEARDDARAEGSRDDLPGDFPARPDDGAPSEEEWDEASDGASGPEGADPASAASRPAVSATPGVGPGVGLVGPGVGLVPPVGAASLVRPGPDASRSAALETDGADPLMPPAAASPAAERPLAGGFGAQEDLPQDARAPEGPSGDEPEADREPDTIFGAGPATRASGPPAGGMPVVARAFRPDGEVPPDPAPSPEAVAPATAEPRRDPEPARAEARRGGGGVLAPLLLSVLAAGGVAYGVSWWFDQERAGEQAETADVIRVEAEERVAALEAQLGERLTGLEAGSAELAARLDEAAAEGEAPAAAELAGRLDALDTRLAEIEATADDPAQAGEAEGRIAELSERVDALYAGLPEGGEAEAVSPDALTPLRQALSAQDGRLTEVAERLDALDARLSELGDVGGRIDGLSEEVAALRSDAEEARGGLSEEIATLREEAASAREGLQGEIETLRQSAEEARGGLQSEIAALREEATSAREGLRGEIEALRESSETGRDALQGEIEALRGEVAGARALVEGRQAALQEEVAAARAAADAEAEQARAEAALARMRAAIEAGAPYDLELAALLEYIDTPLPATLLNAAQAGIPSLAQLRETFPEQAREALEAVPAAEDATRAETFLRRQLGVRSLTARPGSSPDAVLSRAEAELAQGDLAGALAELEALPPEARATLEEWIADAEARVVVQDAATDLVDQLEAG